MQCRLGRDCQYKYNMQHHLGQDCQYKYNMQHRLGWDCQNKMQYDTVQNAKATNTTLR